MGFDFSAVPAILVAAGSSFATYVALVSLLLWFAILTLFRPTDGDWLRVFTIVLLTVFLGFGGYALITSATEVQQEADDASEPATPQAARPVDAPLRLVVRGGPTDDSRVRDAFLLAVRWNMLPATVVEIAFADSRTDLTTAAPAYDSERARMLMAEAGHPDGVPIELRLADEAMAQVVQAVHALQADWSAIGTVSIVRGAAAGAAASTVTVDVLSHR